ncbi:MAG: NADH-quinone oxidoreductase subunit C [Desulfobacteraceae bacterium]|nr:NADH-quinone oxidoreductase subunit C [Desulfobacteraceae bacterium]
MLDTLHLTKETLREEVEKMKSKGYRFVTITCLEIDEDFVELLYHFDKDLELIHYRMQVAKGTTMPSVSTIFFAAFLVENEIYDQFGIKFDDLVLDFGGTLYLDEDEEEVTSTPFCRYSVKRK